MTDREKTTPPCMKRQAETTRQGSIVPRRFFGHFASVIEEWGLYNGIAVPRD